MNVSLQNLNAVPNFNIEIVKDIICDTAVQICLDMTDAFLAACQQGMTVRQLSESYTIIHLDQFIGQDAKIQRIYSKLLDAVKEHIEKIPPLLFQKVFENINQQSRNNQAADLFLGSFVWGRTQLMVDQLKAEQPKSLICKEFWQKRESFLPDVLDNIKK